MFAVISIGGKQYPAIPSETLEVEHFDGKIGDTIVLDSVLLTESDTRTQIGTPAVSGAKVKAKVLAQYRGEKIKVRRFKAKVRYRKIRGFRPDLTRLLILSIEGV